jgi:uncharacterized protein YfbU (UPF0304 family)
MSGAYFVKKADKSVVSVCRSAFLGILNLTKHRVEGVLRTIIEVKCPRKTEEGIADPLKQQKPLLNKFQCWKNIIVEASQKGAVI